MSDIEALVKAVEGAQNYGPADAEAAALLAEIIAAESMESGNTSLRDLTPKLKAYRFHQKYPYALPAIGAILLLGAFALGRASK